MSPNVCYLCLRSEQGEETRRERRLGEIFVEGVVVFLEVLVVRLDVLGVDSEGDVESVEGDGAEVMFGVEGEELSAGDDDEGRRGGGVRMRNWELGIGRRGGRGGVVSLEV